MKIAVITSKYWPYHGGVEQFTRKLAEGLARRYGDKVIVIHTFAKHDDPHQWLRKERPRGKRDKQKQSREEREKGGVHRQLPYYARLEVFRQPVFPLGLHSDVKKEIRASDVVLINGSYPTISDLATLVSWVQGKPVVYHHHFDGTAQGVLGKIAQTTYNQLLAKIPPRLAQQIIMFSRSYATTSPIIKPYLFKTNFIFPWTHGEKLPPSSRISDGKSILFVGRLVPYKGLETLLFALAYLKKQREMRGEIKEVKVRIVGKGPEEQQLKKLSKSLGLESIVEFLGFLKQEDLEKYWREAEIFCFPSSYRQEAFGIAAAEALTRGIPVVASRIPGVSDFVIHNKTGLLAQPLNVKDYAKQLEYLLTHPEVSRKLGEEGRTLAQKWFNETSNLEKYRRVLIHAMEKKRVGKSI